MKVGVDITERVEPEHASILCAHHIALALAYFEAANSDALSVALTNAVDGHPGAEAAENFIAALTTVYDLMDQGNDNASV